MNVKLYWDHGILTLEIQFGASWDSIHPDDERLAWMPRGRLQVTQASLPSPTMRAGWGRWHCDRARGCCYN